MTPDVAQPGAAFSGYPLAENLVVEVSVLLIDAVLYSSLEYMFPLQGLVDGSSLFWDFPMVYPVIANQYFLATAQVIGKWRNVVSIDMIEHRLGQVVIATLR